MEFRPALTAMSFGAGNEEFILISQDLARQKAPCAGGSQPVTRQKPSTRCSTASHLTNGAAFAILETGGDGSPSASGIWFEGAMTMGAPPDATDNAVQANIVAAGYGK